MGYSDYCFLIRWALVVCVFPGTGPFHQSYQTGIKMFLSHCSFNVCKICSNVPFSFLLLVILSYWKCFLIFLVIFHIIWTVDYIKIHYWFSKYWGDFINIFLLWISNLILLCPENILYINLIFFNLLRLVLSPRIQSGEHRWMVCMHLTRIRSLLLLGRMLYNYQLGQVC